MTSKTTICFTNPLFGSQCIVSTDKDSSRSSTAQWVQVQNQRPPPPGTPTGNDPQNPDSALQKQLALLTFELQKLHQTLLYFQNNYTTYMDGFKTPSVQSSLSTAPSRTTSNRQSDTPSSCSHVAHQQHQQEQEEDAIDKLLAEAEQQAPEKNTNFTFNGTHSPSPPSCSTSSMQPEDLDATYTLPTRLPTLYIPPLSYHQRCSFCNCGTDEIISSIESTTTTATTTTAVNNTSRRRRNLPPPPPALIPAKAGSQLDDNAVLLKMA